jgi:hypothetical protein
VPDDDSADALDYPTHSRVNAALQAVIDILFCRSIRKYSIHLGISLADTCNYHIGGYRDFTGWLGLSAPSDCPLPQESDDEQVIDTEIQPWPNLRFIPARKPPRGRG